MTDTARSDTLTITRTGDGGDIVLALAGELDLASAPALTRQLDEVETLQPTRLVLDLAGLDFMDSSGLRVLLSARQTALESDHQLVLRHASSQVQRLLEITGIADRFTIEA